MQFMLAMVGDESGWQTEPGEELDEMLDTMGAYNRKLVEAGVMVDGAGLLPPSSAKTARFSDGEAVITDGPFAEAKEHLGGFWVVKAADLDSALALAAAGSKACQAPVEVRPLQGEEG